MIENVPRDPGEGDARQRTVSVAWLAAFWGVDRSTIYRDIMKGALPAYRLPSGTIRVLKSDADRYGRPIA